MVFLVVLKVKRGVDRSVWIEKGQYQVGLLSERGVDWAELVRVYMIGIS
jgi:hypothetical protein